MNLSVAQEEIEIQCHLFARTRFAPTKEQLYINHVFAICVNGILIIPTILLNATAIITIWKSSQLKRKPCYFIILVQSMIDLVVGVLGIPVFIFFIASEIGRIPTCFAVTLALRLTTLPIGASRNTLCAMTLERYIAILHPYSYRTLMTKKRLSIGVCCCVTVEFFAAMLSFVLDGIYEIYTMVILALSFFFIAFAYTRIFLVVKKLAKSHNKPQEAVSKGTLTKMILYLREIKEGKSCFVVVICYFVLGFLPTTIAVPFLIRDDQFEVLAIRIWIVTFGLSNSCANSVVFFWTKKMLKKEAVKTFKNMGLC